MPSTTHATAALASLCCALQGVPRAEALSPSGYAAHRLRNSKAPPNQPVGVVTAVNEAKRGKAQP